MCEDLLFSLSYIVVSLGFGLFVEQNKTCEDITTDFKKQAKW